MNTPIRYVSDQRGTVARLLAWLHAITWSVILMGTLLCCNVIQCLSFLFYPFSKWLVWKINRECAQVWWSLLVYWTERRVKLQVTLSGDEIPYGESVLLISNHQQMPDIPVLMTLALRKGRLGDMKWFVKNQLKYVPGIGWGMYFLGCVFLKRNWYSDYINVLKTFERLKNLGVPFWLISFVEGTRIQPRKLIKAQEFARARGYPVPQHTLIPKRKGFVAAVHGLHEKMDAVYDATIFYDDGIPSLWQLALGLCRRARLHVRRFPISEFYKVENGQRVIKSEEELSEWLRIRYQEKDALLSQWENEVRK